MLQITNALNIYIKNVEKGGCRKEKWKNDIGEEERFNGEVEAEDD